MLVVRAAAPRGMRAPLRRILPRIHRGLSSTSGDVLPVGRAQVHELLFQLAQAIFSGLGWRSAHDHASDIGLLVGDAPLDLGELTIRNGGVLARCSDDARKMRRDP